MSVLAWWCLICAAFPALLFLKNLSLYRRPERRAGAKPQISVLIPARNEEANIGPAIQAIQANTDVDFEVIVLDDHSTDRTSQIVWAAAAADMRLRLERAPELPPGWCGKQHACWVLAQHARFPLMVFVDADVRLAPDALVRMAGFLEESGASLASGVPRQVTETWAERLLIPLIHFVLLGFLPLDRMRREILPAYGAGCGQLFIANREAYLAADGHRAIRESMHDGIRLPRAFRASGYKTDLFDATDVASCRMYAGASEVWRGLGKNAAEGLGSPRLIGPMTILLYSGQVLPWLLVAAVPSSLVAWLALGLSLVPRFAGAQRFQQSRLSALLHPVGIIALLCIQWQAFFRHLRGVRPSWRGRQVDLASTET